MKTRNEEDRRGRSSDASVSGSPTKGSPRARTVALALSPRAVRSVRRRSNSERLSEEEEVPAPSLAESSASASEGDDDAAASSTRTGRKRQLPARFRDVDSQAPRRRRVSSAQDGSPQKSPTKPAPTAEEALLQLPECAVSDDQDASEPSASTELLHEAILASEQAAVVEPVSAEGFDETVVPELVAGEDDQQEEEVVLTSYAVAEEPVEHAAAGWPPSSTITYEVAGVSDPLAAAAGAFFASDDELESREASLQVPAELDDDDDLITMEVDSLEVPLPTDQEPREPCKVCHRLLKVSQLRQHMMLHAGLRPFKCEVCHAAFTRRSDVFRHVKIVHRQETPFKCSLDGKEFSDRISLKLHMEQHKRPVLFACKVCDFRFGKFESYVNHIKNIHPTGEPLPSFPGEVEPAPEPLAPPRGRHGPKPLEDYLDEDDIVMSPGGVYLESNPGGDHLDMGSALESIETEEIPHDSMQLVSSEEHQVVTALQEAHAAETDARDHSVHSHDDSHAASAHISMPSLDEDAANILGMTDLALPQDASDSLLESGGVARTSLDASTTSIPSARVSLPTVGRSVSVSSSSASVVGLRRAASVRSHPRVVTIGKSQTRPADGQCKTVLLTRPKMVAGRQVLQAVKLSPGQRIVAARAPGLGAPSGWTAPTRPMTRPRPALATVARLPGIGRTAHVVKTAVPAPRPRAVRAVSAAAPPPAAEPPAAEPAGRSIEVTTSSASGGSRTIVLQTSGDGSDGDILESKEAMQSLLSAVQQLVAASGDTLEGKQIEIVMQNDEQK